MRKTPLVLLVLVLGFAASQLATAPPAARADGDASGTLVTGGSAKGDISKTAGETDTITVDLVAGSRANVKWHAGFTAAATFTDPSGAPVDLGITDVNGGEAKAWLVPATGTYTFRIASADGTQGVYTLSIAPYWDKTVVLEGTGQTTLTLPMPANALVKGKVQPLPGSSNPSILSFTRPDGGELLQSPVVGSTSLAKLPSTRCETQGTYSLTATATGGAGGFRATLKRKAPRIPTVHISLLNGLAQISFSADGIGNVMRNRCADCHDWAASYRGVKGNARRALPRMKSGSMPKGGQRLDRAFTDLFASWIATGLAE